MLSVLLKLSPLAELDRYFVSFIVVVIDDYSKWTVVYFMRHKSEVLACFKLFSALVENYSSATIGNQNVQEYHGDDAIDANELHILHNGMGWLNA